MLRSSSGLALPAFDFGPGLAGGGNWSNSMAQSATVSMEWMRCKLLQQVCMHGSRNRLLNRVPVEEGHEIPSVSSVRLREHPQLQDHGGGATEHATGGARDASTDLGQVRTVGWTRQRHAAHLVLVVLCFSRGSPLQPSRISPVIKSLQAACIVHFCNPSVQIAPQTCACIWR